MDDGPSPQALPHMGETRMEFSAPGFGLVQSWPLESLSDDELFLSPSLQLSNKQLILGKKKKEGPTQ